MSSPDSFLTKGGVWFDQSGDSPLSNGLGGIEVGMSLLERLWNFLGGKTTLEESELHLVNGGGGNSEEGWLLLLLLLLEGEGLRGGKESKEKKEEGCEIEREWLAPWGCGLVVGIWE